MIYPPNLLSFKWPKFVPIGSPASFSFTAIVTLSSEQLTGHQIQNVALVIYYIPIQNKFKKKK